MPAYGDVGTQRPSIVPRANVDEGDMLATSHLTGVPASRTTRLLTEAFTGNWMRFSGPKGTIRKVVLWVGFQARVETGL